MYPGRTSAGFAAYPVQIPPGLIGFRFCAQFAMWPASPMISVASSNYLHVVTGN
jgi:hypothetical protein